MMEFPSKSVVTLVTNIRFWRFNLNYNFILFINPSLLFTSGVYGIRMANA